MADWKNKLYFGDNLGILREHVPDESVDLVYLDPPFNSNATYNVLFKEAGGEGSAAQIHAFDDTWHWSMESEYAYQDVVTHGPKKLADLLQAMRSFLGQNDMMAYLTMMAQRMVELRRVLKPTGSIYLHCDPTASHYLKLLMDAVFGSRLFLNEITWKRSSAHSDTTQGMRRAGKIRDVVLVYTKTDDYVWNPQFTPYTDDYLLADTDTSPLTVADTKRPTQPLPSQVAIRASGTSSGPWMERAGGPLTSPTRHWPSAARMGIQGCNPISRPLLGFSKSNLAGFWSGGRLIHRKTGMPRLMHFETICPGFRCRICGMTSIRRCWAMNAFTTPPRSQNPSWSASSRPAATRATSSSTRSAAAGRRSPSPSV